MSKYTFRPTHDIHITHRDGSHTIVRVRLVDGVAYTLDEWEAESLADWERQDDGTWTFQGRATPAVGDIVQVCPTHDEDPGHPWAVNLWGSHPDRGNDDCWTGDDFETRAEAEAVFTDPGEYFLAHMRGVTHVELRGPDVYRVKRIAPDPAPRVDDSWRREMAMEAGMGLGIDAYNDMMGY